MDRARVLAGLIVVAAGCDSAADGDTRRITLLDESRDATVQEMLVTQSRSVLTILAQPDTSGLGRYLAGDFRWLRAAAGGGSPTTLPRVRPDARYFERLPGGIPVLAVPVPSEFQARPSGATDMIIEGLEECERPDCEAWPVVRLRWRLTADGWRLAELLAAGEPRR